jgi:hypothetical protein
MKIYGINLGFSSYLVSLIYLLTTIILNVNQYKNNPYYYQKKNNEHFIDNIVKNMEYNPTILELFFSLIGINGYYENGVIGQTLYIIFTFILYVIVESVFGSIVALIIFGLLMLSSYYYTWSYKSKLCNDTTLYNIIPSFCCGSSLMVPLLAIVQLIMITKSKNKFLKMFLIFVFILTYIGISIYDNFIFTSDKTIENSISDKICNSTMWHGFFFIQGIIIFIVFYTLHFFTLEKQDETPNDKLNDKPNDKPNVKLNIKPNVKPNIKPLGKKK